MLRGNGGGILIFIVNCIYRYSLLVDLVLLMFGVEAIGHSHLVLTSVIMMMAAEMAVV